MQHHYHPIADSITLWQVYARSHITRLECRSNKNNRATLTLGNVKQTKTAGELRLSDRSDFPTF